MNSALSHLLSLWIPWSLHLHIQTFQLHAVNSEANTWSLFSFLIKLVSLFHSLLQDFELKFIKIKPAKPQLGTITFPLANANSFP